MIEISKLNKNDSIVMIKTLCLIQRQMLYCPKITALPYEKLFAREYQNWSASRTDTQDIIGDFHRTPQMTQFITQYITLMQQKVTIQKDFAHIVNTAYVLQKNTVGSDQVEQNSPLQINFLAQILKVFGLCQQLHTSIFSEDFPLLDIRLSIVINLIEEEYLLLSFLTHLNLAFKVMYRLKR